MKKNLLLSFLCSFMALGAMAQSIGPLTEPSGEPSLYTRTELKRDILYQEIWDSGIADLIYFDHEYVYIRNLMSDCADGTYIQGKITSGDRNNGVITFVNGAYIASNYRVYCTTYDEYGSLTADTEPEYFCFNIEDGIIRPQYSEVNYGPLILIAVSSYQWSDSSLAVIIDSFTPYTEPETFAVPDNLTWQKYELYCEKVDDNDPVKPRFAQVARSGKDFFITDFNDRFSTLTLKGTLSDDNIVEFHIPSYLGIHNGHFCDLHTGSAIANVDKFGLFTNYSYTIDDNANIYMQYDPDSGDLTSEDMFIIATGTKAFPGHLNKPQLLPSMEVEESVVPEGLERIPYQMLSSDLSIPGTDVRAASKIDIVRDGDYVYFVGFNPMYRDLGFKGKINADGTKITVNVPQYLGKSQYDEDIYLYTVATDVEESMWYAGFYDVYYQANDIHRTLTFIVDGQTITSNDNIAAAPQFGTPYYAVIKGEFTPYAPGEAVTVPTGVQATNYLATSLTYPGSAETNSNIVKISRDDDTYYIKGIYTENPELAFKGTYSATANNITVPMPQYMGKDKSGNDVYLTSCVARAQDPGWGGITAVLTADYTPTVLTLTCESENLVASTTFCALKYGGEPGSAMIGATFSPYDKQAAQIPDDATYEQYAYSRTILDGWTGELRPQVTEVAHKDNDYFIIHNFAGIGKVVMTGHVDGDKLLVPTDQYIGVNQPLYVCAGNVTDDYWDLSYTRIEKDNIVFNFDAATGAFNTAETMVFYLAGGKILDYIAKAKYNRYNPKAEAPIAPVPIDFEDRSGWWGAQYQFSVNIPCRNDRDEYMDVDKMKYRIYFDNKLYTFDPSIYIYDDLDSPTTDIPYTKNANCFSADAISDMHVITLYEAPNRLIGIQSGFEYKGETYWSPISNLNIVTGEISVEYPQGRLMFGYSSEGENTTWGTQKGDAYDVAISLCDAGLVGKKITGIKVPVIESMDISDYSIWLSKTLKVANKTNQPDIMSVEVTPSDNMIEYIFETPYEITEDGCYAGYSFLVNNVTEATKNPVVISPEANEGGFYIHTTNTYRTWGDRSKDLGVTSAMLVCLSGDFPNDAAAVRKPDAVLTQTDNSVKMHVQIVNHGTNPINNIDYSLVVGNTTHTGTMSFDQPIPAIYNRRALVEIELPAFYITGTYNVTLNIDKVNGNINLDTNASTDFNVSVVSAIPVNRPVVEEWTGTWCGWCVKGFVALDKMKELYPDDFIAIAYHNEDPMMLGEGFYPDVTEGFPYASINRTVSGDPYYMNKDVAEFGLEEAWLDVKSAYVPVDVTINSAVATDETLKVKATVQWIEQPASGDYAIEYVVVADDIHGTGTAWVQSNYISGLNPDEIGYDFAEYCAMPQKLYNFHFNDVAILNTGANGVDGSIPADIIANEPIEHEYEFDLTNVINYMGNPIPFDKDKLRVVAMLIRRNADYGRIMNSYMKDVTYISGINKISTDADVVDIKYYDITGRIVKSPATGVYIKVTRLSNGTTLSQKVILK